VSSQDGIDLIDARSGWCGCAISMTHWALPVASRDPTDRAADVTSPGAPVVRVSSSSKTAPPRTRILSRRRPSRGRCLPARRSCSRSPLEPSGKRHPLCRDPSDPDRPSAFSATCTTCHRAVTPIFPVEAYQATWTWDGSRSVPHAERGVSRVRKHLAHRHKRRKRKPRASTWSNNLFYFSVASLATRRGALSILTGWLPRQRETKTTVLWTRTPLRSSVGSSRPSGSRDLTPNGSRRRGPCAKAPRPSRSVHFGTYCASPFRMTSSRSTSVSWITTFWRRMPGFCSSSSAIRLLEKLLLFGPVCPR